MVYESFQAAQHFGGGVQQIGGAPGGLEERSAISEEGRRILAERFSKLEEQLENLAVASNYSEGWPQENASRTQ